MLLPYRIQGLYNIIKVQKHTFFRRVLVNFETYTLTGLKEACQLLRVARKQRVLNDF
jgi:hypothetical protein